MGVRLVTKLLSFFFLSLMVPDHFHQSPPVVPILTQANSFHIIIICLIKIGFNIIRQSTPMPLKFSDYCFVCVCQISFSAVCFVHHILRDITT
jgi:hypothetical protein